MRPLRRSGRVAVTLALALSLAGTANAARIQAAEKLEDLLSRDWYYTEVVVFLRPGVHDYASEERLTGPAAPLDRSLRTFLLPPEERWSGYALSRFTRAHLAFPYLDASRLDLFTEPRPPFEDLEQDDDEVGPIRRADPAAGAPPPPIAPRLAPDPLLDFLRDLAAFEASLEPDAYRPLDPETHTLAAHARAITRRGGYRVLLHRRWLQPVPAREAPEPLLIQAGPRHGNTFALEGTFEVTRGRYLHFGAHLLYTEPLLGQAPLDRALPPPGLVPAAAPTAVLPGLRLRDLEPRGFMQLRENRRISDDRIAYFDHPKLGVLVSVQPVAPPPALLAAYQALEQETR